MLGNTPNQPTKFRTRNWVETNDESRAAYNNVNNNNNIKFKASMVRSNLCDYADAYILVKGTITVPNMAAADAAVNDTNKKVIFKNCAPFTNYITEINNTQIENAEHIDIVMPMYNLIEYSDAYSKMSERLWQYYRDKPALGNNGNIIDFHANSNSSVSFKFKQQIAGKTGNGGTKNVEIMVPLKYVSNFWRALEMPLINCEIYI